MNNEQFKIIMQKISKLDPQKIEHDGFYKNNIYRITAYFDNGRISIDNYSTSHITVKILPQRSLSCSVESYVKYPFGFLAILSPSWYRWRFFCRKIEKETKNKNKKIEEAEEAKRTILIEESIIELFPEILEKSLFGDQDDP